jgi:hypothetical protein
LLRLQVLSRREDLVEEAEAGGAGSRHRPRERGGRPAQLTSALGGGRLQVITALLVDQRQARLVRAGRSVSAGDSWRLAGAQLKLGYKRIQAWGRMGLELSWGRPRSAGGGQSRDGIENYIVKVRAGYASARCRGKMAVVRGACRESRWGPSRMRGLNTYDVTTRDDLDVNSSPRPTTTTPALPRSPHTHNTNICPCSASSSEVRPQHALLATARG